MKHERKGSIVDNAEHILGIIEGEDRSWIPSKGVEDFNFKWSQLWDLNWWFISENWDDRYIYLSRDDWYEVTVQRCELGKKKLRYYMVYVEKDLTDWIPWELVTDTQWTCHKFRWVRSLRHAMKLWELASENFMWLASPEDYFLTKEEYDEAFKNS